MVGKRDAEEVSLSSYLFAAAPGSSVGNPANTPLKEVVERRGFFFWILTVRTGGTQPMSAGVFATQGDRKYWRQVY